MKKLILCLAVAVIMLACTQPPKTDESATKRADAMALYKKNLDVLKTGLQAFQNEQMEVWADGVAEDVAWTPASYGAPIGTKEDWRKVLTGYVTDWDSIRLKNPIFLPGLDTANYEPDGSVRYYGQWDAVHKSGIRTSVNFYGSYEFNKDSKIVSATDFFDVGGMMNSLAAKSK